MNYWRKTASRSFSPEEQTCCGQPAFNAGYRDEARKLARRFLSIFGPLVESGEVDAVVAPSGSCATMTSHFFEAIFQESKELELSHQAERLASVTFELTEFLVDVLGLVDTGAHLQGKAVYHPCCHLYRELGVDEQPRKLLDSVEGLEIVDLPHAHDCCGFGGLFAIKNSGISAAMGRAKARSAQQSGADAIVLCDVSCMTHINGILSREGLSCRAHHIAEILNDHLGGSLGSPSTPRRRPKRITPVAGANNRAGPKTVHHWSPLHKPPAADVHPANRKPSPCK